jgi:acylphosphatase
MAAMKHTPFALLIVLLVLGAAAADPVKPAADAKVGRTVYYTGQVQGVGFRATAVDIARDYRVSGWVKNLADGRVQLVAEGTEDEVKKFLKAIRDHWKKNIEKEQVEEQATTGKYTKFEVAY